MAEFFLEDVLEKTKYTIKPESESIPGNSRGRRKRQQESKKEDSIIESFEVLFLVSYLHDVFMVHEKLHYILIHISRENDQILVQLLTY